MPLPAGPSLPSFPNTKGLQSGISLNQLVALFGSTQSNVVAAAGGGKANAIQLTSAVCKIITCATAADSVLLPPAYPGLEVFLTNRGAQSVQVFGANVDTIDDVATGIGVAQAAGKSAIYRCTDETSSDPLTGIGRWYRVLSA